MTKTIGAKNIVPFTERTSIQTIGQSRVRHLAKMTGSPLGNFEAFLGHQANFLRWISSRHRTCQQLAKRAGKQGPKKATFDKYMWYAQTMGLLQSINAFELFYKETFIRVAESIRPYIQPDQVKGQVDARCLWLADPASFSAPRVLFESRLFHSAEAVNEAAKFVVGKGRFDKGKPGDKERSRLIDALFQVRHTLSHNGGLVTKSDAAKFLLLRFTTKENEVIEPLADRLAAAISEHMLDEAKSFTVWLQQQIAAYLVTECAGGVPSSVKSELMTLLGDDETLWSKVNWV